MMKKIVLVVFAISALVLTTSGVNKALGRVSNPYDRTDLGSIDELIPEKDTIDYVDATVENAAKTEHSGTEESTAGSRQENRESDNLPGPEVAELVNLRGDEVTVYKLADGTYLDRIERSYTYNGTDTWTDEDGIEWNEKAY